MTRWKEYTACLKKKCKRLCDYLIWGSTTLSHWALPGGSSLGNTKIIENTKMVKEMRQSTRTHTYTHARLMKSKRNIYKKKVYRRRHQTPIRDHQKKEGRKTKKNRKTPPERFPFFSFSRVHALPPTTAAVWAEGKKIIKPSCAFSVSQVATSC